MWKIPEGGLLYEYDFNESSAINNLPDNLLARIAKEECNFIPSIIDGSIVSSANAIGIMQIVPKWHPDVNPYNPTESIHYSGKYIRYLFNQFGSWELAIAAYNWGMGNLRKKGFENRPTETKNYVINIMTDVFQI